MKAEFINKANKYLTAIPIVIFNFIGGRGFKEFAGRQHSNMGSLSKLDCYLPYIVWYKHFH